MAAKNVAQISENGSDIYKAMKTLRGEVLGSGSFKIPKSKTLEFRIPVLSFIVIERPKGGISGLDSKNDRRQ